MKTENKKTLRGSVLFTVVCVMALLIIFLTGTLALATASSNRAHKSYSSSQASYTARAAIDTFVQSMERNPGIPAAIENMGSDPLKVEMKLNDTTLGVLGSYDDETHKWEEGVIRITPVADSAGYIYTDIKGDGTLQWVPVTAVKVTATCRVGKEEETVSAIIQKTSSGHSEMNPGGLDGLQEVGGNAFPNGGLITGGFGLGISKDGTGLYVCHNQTKIETKLSFINGSIVAGTGSFEINIKNPVDSKTGKIKNPDSKTVIMGSVYLRDTSQLVNLGYKMASDFNQRDIPYIYIDQTVAGTSGLEIARTGKFAKNDQGKVEFTGSNDVGKAPFNIFMGTFSSYAFPNNVKMGGADLYLLDEYTSDSNKYTVMYSSDRNYTAEELSKADNGRSTTDDKTVIVGQNYFGKDNQNAILYDWASSYVNKADTQHKTTGGNIYSMGNLTLEKATVNGSVRVNQNCTIKKEVVIYGDLVVKGTLTFDGGNPTDIHGDIYCDNITNLAEGDRNTERLKECFIEHKNSLLPRYKEVHNFTYENDLVPDSDCEQIIKSEKSEAAGWKYVITKPGDTTPTVLGWENDKTNGIAAKDYCYKKINGEWYEGIAYYETDKDGYRSNKVVTNSTVTYKGDPTLEGDEEKVWIDDDGNPVYGSSKDEYSYYRMNDDGTVAEETDEAHAIATYYTKEGDPYTVYGRSEAYGTIAAVNHKDYVGGGMEPAYPDSMTRKAIYGYDDPDTHAFVEADPKTKLIKNIYDVREDLNMDEYGDYDEQVYKTHVPKEFCTNSTDDSFIDDPEDPRYDEPANVAQRNKLPYAFNNDGTPNTDSGVWSDGKIIRSCIIGRTDGGEFKLPNKKNVNIVGSGDGIWVILRHITTTSDSENNFLCDTSKGKVCFLIDGELKISKTSIRPVVDGESVQAYTENCIVTPESSWGIEYYGTPPTDADDEDTYSKINM